MVEAELPYIHPVSGRRIVPDLSCDGNLLVEFHVSHRVGAEKRELVAQLGIPCIEIDLGPFIDDWLDGIRHKEARPALQQLTEVLVANSDDRAWLFDLRVQEWLDTHRVPDIPALSGSQLSLFSDFSQPLEKN